ncbi:hypothetical protein [Acanthopleuribacter pedis]|uniref:Uncharacterized protein n=1 Tax=Acanthopleuribacter pedis TaxID=442870 RepID=A0A8J7QH10_9BACT|nr:hypothetical protein [Acanthopleuribacter pedis]MBO1322215.1 hypothetical protein [Acanthopleuribacter pedis]
MSVNQDLLSILEEGRHLVLQEFPQAQFCEAEWRRQESDAWRFVYNDPATRGTVLLVHGANGFETPRHIDAGWLEDRVIPFPVPMRLKVAENLAQKAGFDGELDRITLRWPLFPGSNEPCYRFDIPSQHVHVFVGVYTHQVHTSPLNV